MLEANESQWVDIATSCATVTKPGLQGKDFSAASNCMVCPVGQMPVVNFTSSGVQNGPTMQLPKGSGGSVERAASFSICFQPWSFGATGDPLSMIMQVGTLDLTGKVALSSKVVDLPIDNFAGVDLQQNQ